MTPPTDIEVLDDEPVAVCGGCERPLDDEPLVPVGVDRWHQRCALLRVVEGIAELVAPPRALLTAEQVAVRLGESASSVRRRKAVIGFVRLRRDGVADEDAPVRFRPEDVDRYIAENYEPPVVEELPAATRRPRPVPHVVEQHDHLLPRRLRGA